MPDTWLCTFRVSVDLPITMSVWEMENAIAKALSTQLPTQGLNGNCIVTLTATAGNTTVHDADPATDMDLPQS